MKYANIKSITAIVSILFIFAGCTELVQVVGDVASQQAYNETYNKKYKEGLRKGMTEAEARAYAEGKAEAKAANKQQLFAGISDVTSSMGDIDYETERAMGESLALEGIARFGKPVDIQELQRYVNLVGKSVASYSDRPDIPYQFIVVESPIYNAFAAPGGIIFISSALVKSLSDESELACVLAHEVGHVTHKHALESIKRAKFFEGAGKITATTVGGGTGEKFKGIVDDLQNTLFDKGLDKNMEFEADEAGMEIAYRTGYDPTGMIRVLKMLQKKEADAAKEGSWFSTHPPLSDRLEKLNKRSKSYHDAKNLARVEGRFKNQIKSL